MNVRNVLDFKIKTMNIPNSIKSLKAKLTAIRLKAALALKEKIKHKQLKRPMSIEMKKAIVAEFNLIQEKKSKLSKNKRDFVENQISYLIHTGQLQVKINKQ